MSKVFFELPECCGEPKHTKSGFKTSDQVRGPRMPTGFHIYFYENFGVQQASRTLEAERTRKYLSISMCGTTQPLGLLSPLKHL